MPTMTRPTWVFGSVVAAALVTTAGVFGSAEAREFDWVEADAIDLSWNPSFLRTCLALTADGEPVRASLISAEQSVSLTFFGDVRLDHRDTDGNLLWSDLLTGKVHVQTLEVLAAGDIVLHGTYRGELHWSGEQALFDPTESNRDFLMRLNSDREVVWLLDYDETNPSASRIETLAVDESDQVWLGMTLLSGGSVLRRLALDGSTAEEYVQAGAHGLSSISFDPDGSAWVAGATSSGLHSFGGFEAESPFPYAMYLARYDAAGTGQWAHFIEDVTGQFPRVVADGNGAAYFAGSLHGDFDFGNLSADGVDWVFDFFLTKVDANGQFLWLQEVPSGVGGDAGIGVGPFLDAHPEGVVFSGFSRLNVDWGGNGEIPQSWGSQDALVLGFDSDGDVEWAKTAGSTGYDVTDAVAVDDFGNVFVAGHVSENAQFDDETLGTAWANNFIGKLGADETPATTPSVGLSLLPATVSPNPVRTDAHLRFRMEQAGVVSVTVFDVSGARVSGPTSHRVDSGWNEVPWSAADELGQRLSAGAYRLRVDAGARRFHAAVTVLP